MIKAYEETVKEFYEGLPKGKTFATVTNPKWRQNEMSGDQVGDVTAPSDMEMVMFPSEPCVHPLFSYKLSYSELWLPLAS